MAAKEVGKTMAISEVEKVLPMEIWHEIWSSLDFNTLQKICVLVSKTWKFEIRNQPKFSNEVKIKTMDHELEDITAILSSWPVLEKLYVTCQKEMQRLGIKLKFQEVNCLQELDSFGEVKMLFLDPKNIQAPVEMKHISWFQINESGRFLKNPERKIELEVKIREMQNLSILSIDVDYGPWNQLDWFLSLGLEKVNWIEFFMDGNLHHFEMKSQKKKSKTISISHLFSECWDSGKFEKMLKNISEFQLILRESGFMIEMHQFLGILNSMSAIKNLIIDGDEIIKGEEGFYFLSVHNYGNRLDEKETEECFENAMEIIEKFPRDETKFEIREAEYGFAIKKTIGNPPELSRIFEDEDGRVI